jgi:hypothetical protein
MPQHGDDRSHQEAERNAEHRAVADVIPDWRIGDVGDDRS